MITNSNVSLVNREEILTPIRVPSVFKERTAVRVKDQSIDNEDGPIVVLDKIRLVIMPFSVPARS